MEEIRGNSGTNSGLAFITGVLIGGIVGSLAGMFLAPASGVETRRKVWQGMGDALKKGEELAEKGKETLESVGKHKEEPRSGGGFESLRQQRT